MAQDSDDPVYTSINKLGDLQDVKDVSVEPTDKSTLVYNAADNQYVPTAPSANVADVAAPAALTSAALTGGESPTEAEFNALQADVAALLSTVTALRSALNSALTAMEAHGITAAS